MKYSAVIVALVVIVFNVAIVKSKPQFQLPQGVGQGQLLQGILQQNVRPTGQNQKPAVTGTNISSIGGGQGGVQNGAVTGQGNALAQAPPGGFGGAIGVGGAIQTPLGSFALGEGQSFSLGK